MFGLLHSTFVMRAGFEKLRPKATWNPPFKVNWKPPDPLMRDNVRRDLAQEDNGIANLVPDRARNIKYYFSICLSVRKEKTQ